MSNQTSSKKMGDYLMVAWKRKWIILAFIALGAGGSLFWHHKTDPRYKTTMTVRLASGGNASAGSAAAEYLAGVMDSATLQATNLAVLQDDKLKAEMVDEQILAVAPVPKHFRGRSRDEIIDEVTAAISVTKKAARTNLVLITVEGTVPELLPDLASRFWKQFSSMQSTIQSNLMDRGLAQAKKEMSLAHTLWQEAESDLQEHLRKSSFSRTSFLTCRERLPEMESELRRQQDEVQTSLLLKAEIFEGIQTALDGEGDAGLVRYYDEDIITSNEEVQKLQQEIATHKSDFADFRKSRGIGPMEARWKAYEQIITAKEKGLHVLCHGLLVKFVQGYRGMQKHQKALIEEQALLTRDIAKFEEVARIYDRLKTDVDVTKKRHETSAVVHDDILRAMARAMADDNTGIVFAPSTPKKPFNLNLMFFLGLGIFVGLLMGVGLAAGLEAIDDSIRTEEDVEQILKLPCLGVIHQPDSRRGGTPAIDLASIVDPRSIFAEEFRSIRTSLGFTFDRRRERHYALAVSSFQVQEGKTTVSTNLASVIAASGLRTLLVDADMRNGRIHRTFGVSGEKGLSDVLAGQAELDQTIEETEVANLSILPAGNLFDNPAEMLESPAMRDLLQELSERFDRVVFDTPPAGPVTDPLVLGKQVDALVLVTATGKVHKRLVKRLVQNMLAVGVRIAGVVLNEMKPGKKRYYRKYLHLYRRGA
jgi:polysaccharide biosynthesis transport protein